MAEHDFPGLAERIVAANALAALAAYASLHSAEPGATGAHELARGRQALSWDTSTGSLVLANDPEWACQAGDVVAYVGFWTLSSGGVWHRRRAVSPAPITLTSNRRVRLSDLSITFTTT